MDKKIPIASIGIMAILLLASFSSIIVFQSAQSSSIKETPLFDIRIKNANNKEGKQLTYNYIRKDKDIDIPFPAQSNDLTLFQKVTYKISRMNYNEYKKIVFLVVNRLLIEKKIKNEDVSKIVIMLNQLKNNPDKINYYFPEEKKDQPTRIDYCFTVPGVWETCDSSDKCKFYTATFILIFILLFISEFIFIICQILTINACY